MSQATKTNHERKLEAWARAVYESDLDAAIADASERLETEKMFIDALHREKKVRAETGRIHQVRGENSEAVGLYAGAQARITAEAIVDADEKIEAMDAKRNAAA